MVLSERLSQAARRPQNRGCVTCKWLAEITAEDRAAIESWLNNGWSARQLHRLLITDPDRPLPVGETAFKNHLSRGCSP